MACEHSRVDVQPRFTEVSESVYAYVGVCADCGATGPDSPTVDGAAAGFFVAYPSLAEAKPDMEDR